MSYLHHVAQENFDSQLPWGFYPKKLFLARYEHITARMRAMHRERFELLQAAGPAGSSAAGGKVVLSIQRIVEIERQLPEMLRRHKLVREE